MRFARRTGVAFAGTTVPAGLPAANSAIERNNVQAVFVYRYLPPFGTLQVACQCGTAAFGQPSTQGNTMFLKATTVF